MKVGLPNDITAQVVGRRRELRLMLSALEAGKAVLLLGLPGVSKTTMVRALARHLGDEADRFVDVTGDEQLTGHALVGTFDPPMVLKEGYRPEHFVPGPLTRAMNAGGILYLEEMNRAPSGALNVLMTALSERYLEVPRLGRVPSRNGFTVIGAANPLDDVGTTRLSRGLVDRFVLLELDYQTRAEELAIVARRCGSERAGFHPFAVDLGRESRVHPDLRHGASVRGAIDFADLLAGWDTDELDLDTLRFVACSAYAGKLRVKPSAGRTAAEIVHELIDRLLARDYGGRPENLVEAASRAPTGAPVEGEGEGPPGEDRGDPGGGEKPGDRRKPDEIPGLVRPGTGAEPGDSRSVPMVGRDRPSNGGARVGDAPEPRDEHLRDPELVLRHARELVLRVREGEPAHHGAPGTALLSRPWTEDAPGPLALDATVEAYLANHGALEHDDLHVEARAHHRRDYVILVDHSGSMVGRKLMLAATIAAALAQLSAAGRADYAVIAFDDEVSEIKALGEHADVEEVVDLVLRLPEGRATDLGKVLLAAAETAGEATDVILISDCMPTRGVKTYAGLADLAARVPSLYIAFADERVAAIQMFGGGRQLDLYQWWAQQWVGSARLKEFADLGDVEGVVDLLSDGSSEGGVA
jgi:MoxR-like ATPase